MFYFLLISNEYRIYEKFTFESGCPCQLKNHSLWLSVSDIYVLSTPTAALYFVAVPVSSRGENELMKLYPVRLVQRDVKAGLIFSVLRCLLHHY